MRSQNFQQTLTKVLHTYISDWLSVSSDLVMSGSLIKCTYSDYDILMFLSFLFLMTDFICHFFATINLFSVSDFHCHWTCFRTKRSATYIQVLWHLLIDLVKTIFIRCLKALSLEFWIYFWINTEKKNMELKKMPRLSDKWIYAWGM